MIFVFYSISVVCHSYCFVYAELSLNPRNKFQLIMMYASSNVLFNSIC